MLVFWPRHTWRSQMSPVNSGVTGVNFRKFSHNIQTSFTLLMWFPVPFLNARVTKVGSLPFRSSRSWATCSVICYQTTIHYVNMRSCLHSGRDATTSQQMVQQQQHKQQNQPQRQRLLGKSMSTTTNITAARIIRKSQSFVSIILILHVLLMTFDHL